MELKFDSQGLIPAVVQDARTKEVLMVAHMNEQAFRATVESRRAVYWSRSRGLWRKGEESGNFQEIVDILTDCDEDTIIYKVNQKGEGAACHDGYESCFYRHLEDGEWKYNGEIKKFDPAKVYKK